jgi:sugar transferase EpsL
MVGLGAALTCRSGLATAGPNLLSPLITVAAVLTVVGVRRPILFRQQRPGLLGRPFIVIKFRTMTDERDANGTLEPDAARMRPIGRFLRVHQSR